RVGPSAAMSSRVRAPARPSVSPMSTTKAVPAEAARATGATTDITGSVAATARTRPLSLPMSRTYGRADRPTRPPSPVTSAHGRRSVLRPRQDDHRPLVDPRLHPPDVPGRDVGR